MIFLNLHTSTRKYMSIKASFKLVFAQFGMVSKNRKTKADPILVIFFIHVDFRHLLSDESEIHLYNKKSEDCYTYTMDYFPLLWSTTSINRGMCIT